MTLGEMREALGVVETVSDAEVVARYAATLFGMAPAEEPVTLAEARAQIGMLADDPTDQDALIRSLIPTARGTVEYYADLVLTRRQIVQTADTLNGVKLYAWPIASIDAIGYRDTQGAEQVLAPSLYRFGTNERPARLRAAGAGSLPAASEVTIVMTAGYDAPDAVPAGLKQAMLHMIAHLYADREGSKPVPAAVLALCREWDWVTV